MKSVIKITLLIFNAILLTCIFIVLRTLLLNVGEKITYCSEEDHDYIQLSSEKLEIFQKALRIPTISRSHGDINTLELVELKNHIYESYPNIHNSPFIEYEVIANYSLLYHIKGANIELKPYMLCGHLDVVPATTGQWHAEPFSGKIIDGYVYGRGALDMKHSVFGILEALEYILKNGIQLQRSFYIAFGHDEEILGLDGARNIAATLKSRGIKFEFILDEGLTVVKDVFPLVKSPIALIGIAEKGFMNVKLSVNISGGHSSMPAKESALTVVAKAITRLNDNPLPSMFGRGPEIPMFEALAPGLPFHARLITSNLWLFSSLVSHFLSFQPGPNALIRSTTSCTIFKSGIKTNVIPPTAEALINHRIHPAQTPEEILELDRKIINDDRIKLEITLMSPPSPMSPHGSGVIGFEQIKYSLYQIWGKNDLLVAPGLLVGGTDTKHYLELSNNIYRFMPTFMYPDDVPRFHGLNERLSIKNYEEVINFYYHLIRNSDEVFNSKQKLQKVDL